MQTLTRTDANAFTLPLNTNFGTLKFSKGMSNAFEGQLGFFFGKNRHFGLGAGVVYAMQSGDMTLDQYHVEYKSTDNAGHTFRQLVSTSNLVENLKITNVNIPVVLKYKKRFNKTWGFTADAGILYNMQYTNAYTANGTVDYEAIYNKTTTSGVTTYSYDGTASATMANDIKYTQAAGATASSLSTLRSQGYNVGLGMAPSANTGEYKYSTGSIGFVFQPALNLFLTNNIALNLGLNYMYQPVKNSNGLTNALTDKAGGSDYTSVTRSVSNSNNQSIGANIGIRFFIGKLKDSDHDGTPDIKDKCPFIYGPGELFGCPDFDHDGIPDCEDSCMREPGPFKFHGCPDGDGDGVPDREDACPGVPGLITLHGCPDKDGDGVADKDDACPEVKGLVQFHGCPDTDGDGVPDNEDKCPTVGGPVSNHGCPVEEPKAPPAPSIDMTTPILFEVNKITISGESFPILEEAVKELGENKAVTVVIDGYTDNSGSEVYNKVLSLKRANAVKKYLQDKGVSTKRLKVVGHGPNDPISDNNTPEGRSKNRRATMHLK